MNSDFQRMLDDMDRALRRKQQELTELDERLETARKELSEKEAKEILSNQELDVANGRIKQQDSGILLQEQRDQYEARISSLTEELIETENSNQNLLKAINQLRFEIDSLRVTNEKLKNRAQALNDNLDEVQTANFELNIRLAKAESQAQMQQNLLIKSHEQDQILMNAFNSKLESLKEAIARRDDEIRRLREHNQQTVQCSSVQENEAGLADQPRQDLTNSEIETRSKTSLLNEQQLAQTQQEDERASLNALKLANEKEAYNESSEEVRHLEMRCKMLEVELNEKDRLLHWTNRRIHYFETIFPSTVVDLIENLTTKLRAAEATETNSNNSPSTSQIDRSTLSLISDLSESLDKLLGEFESKQTLSNMVDQLQATILSKDEHIKRLVRELNVINANIDNDQMDVIDGNNETSLAQLTSADEALSGEPVVSANHAIAAEGDTDQGQDATDTKSTKTAEILRKSHQSESETVVPYQQKADDVTEFAPVFNSSDHRTAEDGASSRSGQAVEGRSPPDDQLDTRSESAAIGEIGLDKQDNKLSRRIFADSSHLDLMDRDRLHQLEEENQMLELAMKEILLSIRWSDAKCSTILIDCPSLERLCQLIEARYLADVRNLRPEAAAEIDTSQNCDLFQLVVMKSELDILRGQNEQLRTDLKLIREGNQLESTPNSLRPESTLRGSDPKQVSDDEFGRCEIECQTDSLILISPENLSLMHERTKSQLVFDDKNLPDKKEKCRNCIRLVRLANHLLNCIVRIENRVNSSDESYISRLMALYQLIQRLSKELSSKDSAINQLRREYHNLSQRRAQIEARCRAFENNFELHNRVCPLNHISPNDKNRISKPSSIKNQIEMVPSLTIRTNQDQVEVPLRDGRITIALLQSIIGCLQARLDYKDERLAHLERMLVSS